MTVLNLKTEIKKELKSTDTWLMQIGQVLWSAGWFLNTWMVTTSIITVFTISLILLIPSEAEPIINASLSDFFEFYKNFFIGTSILSAFVVLFFGLPKKVRNVFRDIAEDRVERQREIFFQASLIESVLIRHNLITNEEAKQARLEREAEEIQKN